MKRVYIALLTAVFCLASMLPAPARAVVNHVLCQPGDTFYAVFALAEDGDQPDGVMCRLSYDPDIFSVVPNMNLIGADGFSILNRQPAVLLFRVNKFVPAGWYEINATVVDSYNGDGQASANVKIAPIQVTVVSTAGATPEHTPAPTPTAKPMPLPSAAGTGKKQIQAGDYVTFGHYPQMAEGKDMTPIEWLVLDVQGNKALLLSRYGLDVKTYNEKMVDITWETCTLRAWLNGTFLNKAFTAEEQKGILTTTVDNSKSQGYSEWSTSGGNNTQDKVFLLSYGEANKYLGVTWEYINMKSRTSPTAYAVQVDAYTNGDYRTAEGDLAGWWWLRSPGGSQDYAAHVHTYGSLGDHPVYYASAVIRPALWVNLDAISQ